MPFTIHISSLGKFLKSFAHFKKTELLSTTKVLRISYTFWVQVVFMFIWFANIVSQSGYFNSVFYTPKF